ncbi:hypothetical protein BA763_23745 [Burkholderia cenocepacia]|nr:hypothetical protein BA763_23745 [Burkholderia cenocepacia]
MSRLFSTLSDQDRPPGTSASDFTPIMTGSAIGSTIFSRHHRDARFIWETGIRTLMEGHI